MPVRAYVAQERDPSTGLFLHQPANEGEVIFDRQLTPNNEFSKGRYWDTWLSSNRSHPLLIRVVEELGGKHREGASGRCAELKIVEIPDGVEHEIEEYDGQEHIAEVHRTWR